MALTQVQPQMSAGGPAFSAGKSGTQSVSTSTFTKILLQTENFDTNNNFASSTFTPTVAGYYQINANVNFQASTSVTRAIASIYKNGSEWCRGVDVPSSLYGASVSTLVYCNGTTDYIELYGLVIAATPVISDTAIGVQMSGFLARSA